MLLDFDITQEASQLLLGVAYKRIYTFFMKYDTLSPTGQGHILTQQIIKRLLDDNEHLKLYLCLEQGRVIGHTLITVEKPENLIPYIYVHQFEFDSGHADKSFVDEGLRRLEDLAYSHDCDKIVMSTARGSKSFKQYGFEPFRITMIKTLSGNSHQTIESDKTVESTETQLAKLLAQLTTAQTAQTAQVGQATQTAQSEETATLSPELMQRISALLTVNNHHDEAQDEAQDDDSDMW